ncbi:MAG: basic amino acid ABC transporter substrate-binding protein [Anaerolineae bacterium]|nr:basic amino acid ABC transporter substrate-binding protein [Anaerolineae bacterium]
MKIRKVSLLFLAAAMLLSLLAGCAGGGASKKIVVATDATWPPMEFMDADKNIVGFDVDLMKAIAKEAGLEVEFKNVAWDGIFAGLAAGEYDAVISSVTITEERQKEFDFSEPYFNAGQIVVVGVDSAVTGPDTLSGYTVGAQIGTTGAIAVQEMAGVTLKEYDEVGLAFEDLVAGRLDAVVCDTPTAVDFALQRAEYKAKLKIVGEPFTDEYYGILVQKGNTELLDLINKGLKAVQDSGVDKQLEVQWVR